MVLGGVGHCADDACLEQSIGTDSEMVEDVRSAAGAGHLARLRGLAVSVKHLRREDRVFVKRVCE
jgi:hypothetical protein